MNLKDVPVARVITGVALLSSMNEVVLELSTINGCTNTPVTLEWPYIILFYSIVYLFTMCNMGIELLFLEPVSDRPLHEKASKQLVVLSIPLLFIFVHKKLLNLVYCQMEADSYSFRIGFNCIDVVIALIILFILYWMYPIRISAAPSIEREFQFIVVGLYLTSCLLDSVVIASISSLSLWQWISVEKHWLLVVLLLLFTARQIWHINKIYELDAFDLFVSFPALLLVTWCFTEINANLFGIASYTIQSCSFLSDEIRDVMNNIFCMFCGFKAFRAASPLFSLIFEFSVSLALWRWLREGFAPAA